MSPQKRKKENRFIGGFAVQGDSSDEEFELQPLPEKRQFCMPCVRRLLPARRLNALPVAAQAARTAAMPEPGVSSIRSCGPRVPASAPASRQSSPARKTTPFCSRPPSPRRRPGLAAAPPGRPSSALLCVRFPRCSTPPRPTARLAAPRLSQTTLETCSIESENDRPPHETQSLLPRIPSSTRDRNEKEKRPVRFPSAPTPPERPKARPREKIKTGVQIIAILYTAAAGNDRRPPPLQAERE